MSTIPDIEPTSLRAGDTIQWSRSLADYPASSWTLSYTLINAAAKITFTAAASGTDYLVTVAAATSANYAAGWYDWQAVVTKGTEKHTVGFGRLEILPNLAGATTYDNRSHAQVMLDAIESTLEGKASNDQLDLLSATFGNHTFTRNPEFLLKYRDRYRSEVNAERQAARLRQGLGSSNRISVRLA